MSNNDKHVLTNQIITDAERIFLDNLDNGIVIVQNIPGHYPVLYANTMFSSLLGKDINATASGETFDLCSFISSSDADIFARAMNALNFSASSKEAYRIIDSNNELIWLLGSHKRDTYNNTECILITYTSIQDLMTKQSELTHVNDKWSNLANSIPVGLAIFNLNNGKMESIAINNRLINFSNEIGRKLDGQHRNWSESELMLLFNQNIYAFTKEEFTPVIDEMLKVAKETGYAYCVFQLRGSNRTNPIWIRSYTSFVPTEGDNGIYYITYSDATLELQSVEELRRNHERMRMLSFYDPLTKVHSRNAYNEMIEYSKTHAFTNVGFIFSDVNGLKSANDTYGHRFGDHMICKFADILRQSFENDNIYRISGDEFVVIVPEIELTEFKKKAKAACKLAAEENSIASIGYLWEEKPAVFKDVITNAEQLMYVEKQKYYATKDDDDSRRHAHSAAAFMKDVENGLYMMYLQPKANINETQVIGAEALVRKKDSDGKIVPPDAFIPFLEKEKLIPFLDFFMLEEACKTLARWEKEGRPLIRISVNMSRVTLAENNFLEHVQAICNKYNVNRSLVEFEVTESTATMDVLRLKDELLALKNEGFSVSLDDMGTDYSALTMLLVDGFNTVKLDRNFISKLSSEKGTTLIKYTIAMTHALGLNCIAEGVETDNQREVLSAIDCDMYQGYLLSKPIPVTDFEKLL